MKKTFSILVYLLVLVFIFGCSVNKQITNSNTIQTSSVHNISSTPPMGWNAWNCFRTRISAKKIKEIANAMVSSGMKAAGYRYVIIDDGWMTDKRDKEGHIIIDFTKFPKGIKPVVDYIHSLGLKFGIYEAAGKKTCQGLMGSYGHQRIDAEDFASWGVDYLKYDRCYFGRRNCESKEQFKDRCHVAFELMGAYLKNTGRSIIYAPSSHCSGSYSGDVPWVKNISNTHRISPDIRNNWERMLYILNIDANLWQYAGNGYWNDPDMLEVGNTTVEPKRKGVSSKKMNMTEYRTQFSMWCMEAAPLIAGNDLRNMKPEIVRILTNREVIALDQDTLGKQGRRIESNNKFSVWVKKLSGNRIAVALLNKSDKSLTIEFDFDKIGVKGKQRIRDLWEHKNLGIFRTSYKSGEILSHGVKVLLLKPYGKKRN